MNQGPAASPPRPESLLARSRALPRLMVAAGLVCLCCVPLLLQIENSSRGLVYAGLLQAKAKGCEGLFELAGTGLCTHGPDPAPEGYDIEHSVLPIPVPPIPVRPLPGAIQLSESALLGGFRLAPAAASPELVTCDGDGSSGKRVQVMYVRATDKPDRYNQYLLSMKQWSADMDAIFYDSAVATGGVRRVRFVHDAGCEPTVLNVVLSATGDDNFNNTINELQALGYNLVTRKYLIFADATVYCGIGTINGDDRALSTNLNNNGPSYARVDAGCWGGPTAAHEIMHNLGGVQNSSPHSSGGFHCTDEYDRMCYSDSPNQPTMAIVCTPSGSYDRLFDCGHDDYYHTNPTPGSYLGTHWNSAGSQYLFVATATPVASPTPPLGPILQGSSVAWSELVGNENGAIDPGERISVTLGLQNVGTALAVGITGTLSVLQGNAAVLQPVSAWPTIGIGATGSNLVGFTVQISSTQPCGSLVGLRLAVTYAGSAAMNYDFTLRLGNEVPLGTQSYAYVGPPVAVPDNTTSGITVPITVTAPGEVMDIDLGLNMTHTWDGDMVLYLVAPNQTTVPLALNRGNSGHNFIGTVFDDEGPVSIANGVAPFTGHFRPEFSLSLMDGLPVSGTWKLLAADVGPQDLGLITALTLTVTSRTFNCTARPPGDCNGDGSVSAGDLPAVVLELFDGDGVAPSSVTGGTFAGNPSGCNANKDAVMDAADLSCAVNVIFGNGACAQ